MRKALALLALLFVVLLGACDDGSKKTDSKGVSEKKPQVGSAHRSAVSQGWAAYRAKDYRMAYAKWRPAAEAGVQEAEYMIGRLYDRGRGVTEDDAEANRWYRKAADKGSARAQYRLAINIYYGYGVPNTADQELQWKEAANWFRKSAERGYPRAHGWLGYLYEQGRGVPRSITEAVKWYRKGAALEDRKSLYALAMIQSGDSYKNGVNNVPVDDETAAQNYLKAARLGDYWAAQNLKRLFDEGRTSLSGAEIVALFEGLARKTTDGTGQFHLALIYLEGRLTKRDPAKAAVWLERASKRGFTRHGASYQLAKLYLSGDGVPRDTAKAAKLLEVAAEHPEVEARLRLAFLYANGDGVTRDMPRAYYWATLAGQNGRETTAMRALRVRAHLEARMSPDEILEGQRLVQARARESAERRKRAMERRAKENMEGFAQ